MHTITECATKEMGHKANATFANMRGGGRVHVTAREVGAAEDNVNDFFLN